MLHDNADGAASFGKKQIKRKYCTIPPILVCSKHIVHHRYRIISVEERIYSDMCFSAALVSNSSLKIFDVVGCGANLEKSNWSYPDRKCRAGGGEKGSGNFVE